jgi:hypothetical protein
MPVTRQDVKTAEELVEIAGGDVKTMQMAFCAIRIENGDE